MNENIKNALENFLTTKVYNRALFVDGIWGSGKTHFIKHELFSFVKQYDYGLIYLSVNGISSSIELNKRLIAATLSDIDNDEKKSIFKRVKEKFGRALDFIPKADEFFTIFDIEEIITYDKTVFCFDDIERIGESYPISDMLGYLNSQLLEHKKHKIILVGDRTKNKLSHDSFRKISEKYIGWRISFKTNKKEVIPSISALFKDNSEYYHFLQKHESFIVKVCEDFKIDNYRTIEFFLECLSRIHTEIKDSHERIETEIIYFLLIICQEYKLGNLGLFQHIYELPAYITNNNKEDNTLVYNSANNKLIKRSDQIQSERSKQIQEYEIDFKKYKGYWDSFPVIGNTHYIYFMSLYKYITTGEFIQEEIQEQFQIAALSKPSPKTEEINQNVRELVNFEKKSENELDVNIEQTITDIKEGKLHIYDFATAIKYLHFLISWELLDMTEDQVKKLSRDNFSKISRPVYLETVASTMGSSIYYQDLVRIDEELVEMIKEQEKIWYNELRKEELVSLINKDNDKLINPHTYTAAIETLPVSEICSIIINNLENRQYLDRLKQGIREAYRATNAGEFYKSHLGALSGIIDTINSSLEDKHIDKIDRFYIGSLLEQIEKSIQHINST